jgi:hypothetical protein
VSRRNPQAAVNLSKKLKFRETLFARKVRRKQTSLSPQEKFSISNFPRNFHFINLQVKPSVNIESLRVAWISI